MFSMFYIHWWRSQTSIGSWKSSLVEVKILKLLIPSKDIKSAVYRFTGGSMVIDLNFHPKKTIYRVNLIS